LRPWPVANTLARRRQLRWHVHDLLAVSEQPVRDVPPYALTALDRPRSLRESLRIGQHRAIPGEVGGIAAATQDRLVAGHHLDRGRPLMRIHPNDHWHAWQQTTGVR